MADLAAVGHLKRHPALLDEVQARAQAKKHLDVLIDGDEADPGLGDGVDGLSELRADPWR